MKIQNISYNYCNTRKNIAKQNTNSTPNTTNINNTVTQPDTFNKAHYVSFGADNRNNLSFEERYALLFLNTLPYFKEAAIGMNAQQQKKIAQLFLLNKEDFEDLLSGNYVAVLGSEKDAKKIFDLKEIAEYNRKHPDAPLNLFKEIKNNVHFTYTYRALCQHPNLDLKSNQNLKIRSTFNTYDSEPANWDELIEDCQGFETLIKYRNDIIYNQMLTTDPLSSKLSEKEINELYKVKPSEEIQYFLLNDDIDSHLREKLYNLIEIPYMPAAISNLKQYELEDLMIFIEKNDPIATAALKRKIYLTDANGFNTPLVNVEKIAKYNKTHPENPKNLLKELEGNLLFMKLLVACKSQRAMGETYPFIVGLPRLNNSNFMTYHLEKGQDLNEGTFEFLNSDIKKNYEYFITFKTDLNKKEKNIEPFALPEPEKPKKLSKMPDIVKELMSSSMLNSKQKKSLYKLGDIPYFYENIQNASEREVLELIDMHLKYGRYFRNMIAGNIEYIYGAQQNGQVTTKTVPLVDLSVAAADNQQNPDKDLKLLDTLTLHTMCEGVLQEIKDIYTKYGLKIKNIIYKTETDAQHIPFIERTSILADNNKTVIKKDRMLANDIPMSIISEMISTNQSSIGVLLSPEGM